MDLKRPGKKFLKLVEMPWAMSHYAPQLAVVFPMLPKQTHFCFPECDARDAVKLALLRFEGLAQR